VRLAKPLDRALLNRMLWVTDASGKKVDGTLTVGGGERWLSFAAGEAVGAAATTSWDRFEPGGRLRQPRGRGVRGGRVRPIR